MRAYLLFTDNGSALLGRREADGQWSQLRCRYSCLAGWLLLVQREAGSGYGSDHGCAGEGDGQSNGGAAYTAARGPEAWRAAGASG